MKDRYLEVTFRNGQPLAAYLYLPRVRTEKSVRTENAGPGLLVDYDVDGRPLGIEITDPLHSEEASFEAPRRMCRTLARIQGVDQSIEYSSSILQLPEPRFSS